MKFTDMWDESIRLELLAAAAVKAIRAYEKEHDGRVFDGLYRDLRIEFPTLSQSEIMQVIGLCAKVYGKRTDQ